MSDTADEMEILSSYYESYEEDKLERSLKCIANCEVENFNNETHMINYMKKIAKNLLKDLYYED